MVDGTSEGQTYDGRWSVGNRVRGIEPGDRAYLLRQGTHGRGVLAIGEIMSEPYADDSWRADGGTAQYVDVTWLEAVPLEERIDIRDLRTAVPDFNWDSVYSSGRDITEYGAALEELWVGHATEAAPLPPVVQGAGFGTAEQNRKVEKAAVQHVTDAYEAEDYQVTSVEAGRFGWDLTATRSNEELHLEVKGVAGSLVRFFLTANELKAALVDPNWLLVVVTDALGEPGWHELDGPTAASYAEPALFQVRIPDEAFAD
ncbi:protein NO VEIN domain-containing protein [Kribbella swartbergensis]